MSDADFIGLDIGFICSFAWQVFWNDRLLKVASKEDFIMKTFIDSFYLLILTRVLKSGRDCRV